MASELHDPEGPPEAAGWRARARELARWAWDRYVIRDDVWGGYIPPADRDKECKRPDGSAYKLGATCTRPVKAARGRVRLTTAVLERHFRARQVEDVAGVHTTSLENLSRFGTVEVDHHGPDSTPAEVNRQAVLGWYEDLRRRGFRPLLWDSNGQGGFHLDLLLSAPVPTPRLFWFLRQLVTDHAKRGLPARPETFPKQPRLDSRPDGRGQCGNWVRLPGRHHTRDRWAKVWDGSRWLAGAEAVSFILSLSGDSPELLPEVPVVSGRLASRPRMRSVPPRCRTGNLAARIAAYMARLPNLAEGQGRDDVAYRFATWLVRDLALPDPVALDWLERWDAGNRPPKGNRRLSEILADAHRYGRRAYGSGLGSGHHTILRCTVEVW
jgi:hypothetical protein